MQLALFTPGAYIWPVYRNFEAFIASLGRPYSDAPDLAGSPLYPARQRTDSVVTGLSSAMDERLTRLHRDLYSALLRPYGFFSRETAGFADYFWPDLRHTAVDSLFEALGVYFLNRELQELDIPLGLTLLRSVFFNHEAAAPELWLGLTQERLAPNRRELPEHSGVLAAPPYVRLEQLAFCIHSNVNRPPLSAGWIKGQTVRRFDGRLEIHYRCGLEPGLHDAQAYAAHRARVESDVAGSLHRIFGWQEALAA